MTSFGDWAPLLERVRAGDKEAIEEFYREWYPRLKFYFINRVSWTHADDLAQEVFLEALARVQSGAIHDLACFPGYVWSIAARRIAREFRQSSRVDSLERIPPGSVHSPEPDPDKRILDQEKIEILQRALARLSARQREILTRFYLYEQPPEQIQREMGLTETQYRLLKHRAKVKLGLEGRRETKPNLRVLAKRAGL